MAIPAFLVTKPSAATPGVYRVQPGGSTVEKLADVGTDNAQVTANRAGFDNCVIKLGKELWFRQQYRTYYSRDEGATWTESQNHSAQTHADRHSGLFVLQDGDRKPVLAFIHGNDSASIRVERWNGSSWVSSSSIAGASTNPSNSWCFHNRLWAVFNGTDTLHRYDPVTDAVTVFTGTPPATVVVYNRSLSGFKGRVLLIAPTSASAGGTFKLWELYGGSWTQLYDFSNVENSGNQDIYSNPEFFEDGTGDLFLLLPCRLKSGGDSSMGTLSANGTVLFRLQGTDVPLSSFTVTHLNSSTYGASPDGTLPTILRPGGSNATEYHYWKVLVDSDTDPTTPVVYLLCRDNAEASGSFLSYKWNGRTTAMSAEGSFAAADMRCTQSPLGGGERWFTVNQMTVTFEQIRVIGGIGFKFRVYGDALVLPHGSVTNGPFQVGETITQTSPSATGTCTYVGASSVRVGGVTGTFQNGGAISGGTSGASASINSAPTGGAADKTVKFYFSSSRGIPTTQIQLTGTATGGSASRSGYNVINVTADDGVTEYGGVWWNFLGQGLDLADRVTVLPHVSV